MKFTIPSSVTFLAIFAVSNSGRVVIVVQGVVSPAVACCLKNGGSYELVDCGNAICLTNGSITNADTFVSNNCQAAPDDEEYTVYAYNSCPSIVGAEFI
jgi:hypothetical protein